MPPKSGSASSSKQRGIASFFKVPARAAPPKVPEATPGQKRKLPTAAKPRGSGSGSAKRAATVRSSPAGPSKRTAQNADAIVIDDDEPAAPPDAEPTQHEVRQLQPVTSHEPAAPAAQEPATTTPQTHEARQPQPVPSLERDPQRHAKALRKLATVRTGRLMPEDKQAELEKKKGTKYTPLEQQVVELKKRHPGVLLMVEVCLPSVGGSAMYKVGIIAAASGSRGSQTAAARALDDGSQST